MFIPYFIEEGGIYRRGFLTNFMHIMSLINQASGVSPEGIYRHHFDFFHAGGHLENEETDNLLKFDAEMGRPKVLENLITGF